MLNVRNRMVLAPACVCRNILEILTKAADLSVSLTQTVPTIKLVLGTSVKILVPELVDRTPNVKLLIISLYALAGPGILETHSDFAVFHLNVRVFLLHLHNQLFFS